MLNYKNFFFILLAATIIPSTIAMDMLNKAKKVAIGVPKYTAAYSVLAASSSVFHELGHAIPAQAFFGNVIGFTIFGKPKSVPANDKFFLEIGTNILDGSFFYMKNKNLVTNADKIKAMIVHAAGPLSGVAGACLTKKLLMKTSLNKKFLNWTTHFLCALNLSNFIPYYIDTNVSSDGFKLCELHKAYKANAPCDLGGTPIKE